MPQIGTLYPDAAGTLPVFGVTVKRGQPAGTQLGERPVALVLEGGGRAAGLLALSDEGARQLVRDLVELLGPDRDQAAGERKPAEVKPVEVKPVEVKPVRPEPGPERRGRS